MSTADIHDSLFTVAEVAELLKLNQQTVRNWIDQGSLPAVRVGRRVRIRQSDLERILAEGYSAGGGSTSHAPAGPSAEDFWGGEAVGTAEPPGTDRESFPDAQGASPESGAALSAGAEQADEIGHLDDDRR